MIPDSARTTDAAALALEYGDSVLLDGIRRTHARIAYRLFGATRVVGSRGPQFVHDAVSNTVYGAISGGLRAGSVVARELASRGVGAPMDTSATGRKLRATVNGLVGDQLRLASDPQTIMMTIRNRGADVPASTWWLSQAFPNAHDHLVIFVHGLCESEEVWDEPIKLVPQVAASAVAIRYNSGLAATENGTHLSALLAQLATTWPQAVRRITLVGHGMGGLVIRSAINHALVSGAEWAHRVRDAVFLGVPQTGQLAEKTQQATIAFTPKAMKPAITHGAPGVTGLRRALVNAEEWTDHDVTKRWGFDRLAVGPLPWANHHYLMTEATLRLGALMGYELRHEQISRYLADVIATQTRAMPELGR